MTSHSSPGRIRDIYELLDCLADIAGKAAPGNGGEERHAGVEVGQTLAAVEG